jgi:hypothetical protein
MRPCVTGHKVYPDTGDGWVVETGGNGLLHDGGAKALVQIAGFANEDIDSTLVCRHLTPVMFRFQGWVDDLNEADRGDVPCRDQALRMS